MLPTESGGSTIMAGKKGVKKKKTVKPAKPTAKKPAKKAGKKAGAKKSSVKKVRVTNATTGAVKRKATKADKIMADKPKKISAAVKKRNDQLSKLLLKKRNEVVENLEAQMGRKLVRETGQKIDSAMDSADQSALDMDQGIDYSLLEMKYEQYKDIADAFRKLQNNSYGQCEECGEEIDIKRLEVNPLARYCITCKMNKEALENIQKEETRFKE
jgi:DnaK suppressor protein